MEQHTQLADGSENAARQVRELVHELGTLLDGSMRCLSMAQRTLREGDADADLVRRLDTVRGALDRMADLVRGAMSAGAHGAGATLMGKPICLDEAIRHACEVSADRARELDIDIDVVLGGRFDQIGADRLYVAILNGVRNAIDSIERRGGGGMVVVEGSIVDEQVRIHIRDDGEGLAVVSRGSGMGVGLGLSRSVLRDLGGTLELADRADGGRGATLSLSVAVERLVHGAAPREIGR